MVMVINDVVENWWLIVPNRQKNYTLKFDCFGVIVCRPVSLVVLSLPFEHDDRVETQLGPLDLIE